MDPKTIQSQLKTIPFFERLTETQFEHLIEKGEIRELAAETTLFQENDPASELFLILAGAVEITGTNANGERIHLARLETGQFFGELALADGGERTASAQTVLDSRLFVLSRQAFVLLLSESPQLLSDVIASISQKIRSSNTQYFEEQLDKQAQLLRMEQERNELLAEMVTGVAHEFNTPLGILKTSANIFEENLAEMEISDEDKADLLDTGELINTQVERMHHLIQTMKSISPSEIYANVEAVPWSEFLQEFIALYRSNSLRNLQLELQFDPELQDALWWGYPDVLHEILMNLLLNCELHAYPETDSEAGGRVLLQLQRQAEQFVLRLQDWGRGMSESVLAQVFRPFFTTERVQGCTGLGLAVVHNLVVYALQGEIRLDSSQGQGSTVEMRFPQRLEPQQILLESEQAESGQVESKQTESEEVEEHAIG